jgi:hypothetical protein
MKQGFRPPTLGEPFPDVEEKLRKTNAMKALQGSVGKIPVCRAFQRVHPFTLKSPFYPGFGAPRAAAEGTIIVFADVSCHREPPTPDLPLSQVGYQSKPKWATLGNSCGGK